MMSKEYNFDNQEETSKALCPALNYYRNSVYKTKEMNLFPEEKVEVEENDIRVVELFAGVGGFRIGLERANSHFKTVWSNQWEPSTKRQDASIIYCHRFGLEGHSNDDINIVRTEDIPDCNMLVGGFPCQDYSVATTLKNSKGIEGKKGVLWWEIYRILSEKEHKPEYLFLENVDRILKSPVSQRGRDFAIILASLSDLGYIVEWRNINAADYGMPQRRRRTYILAYHNTSNISRYIRNNLENIHDWITTNGTIAKAFPVKPINHILDRNEFKIEGNLAEVSDKFNKALVKTKKSVDSPFENTGIMLDRFVFSHSTEPEYNSMSVTLGQILIDEKDVPSEFFINESELPQWKYLKGGKSEERTSGTGYKYKYSEGPMAFPDYLDRPSRTIITGEGGSGPSRFKHVVQTPSGRLRRLTPIELERLNMFPDNHTLGASDLRRAFLMGNALVTGIIEGIGRSLYTKIKEYD